MKWLATMAKKAQDGAQLKQTPIRLYEFEGILVTMTIVEYLGKVRPCSCDEDSLGSQNSTTPQRMTTP